METVPNNPLIKVTKEEIEIIRKFYGVEDVKRINESLDAVEEWIKKQDHLVEGSKYMNREYLEKLFILSKGSIENTKKKVDKLLTVRALIPEICLNKKANDFERFSDIARHVILPRLSPKDTTRIIVNQIVPDRFDDFSLLTFLRYFNMIGEYRLHYDYVLGERFIIDMKHISIVSKMNPILFKKGDAVAEAYGNKVKGIHILNAPPLIDAFVRLFKQAVREKVGSRVHVHKTYEELYDHIPKEILPEDFGGDELSIAKLCDIWREHLNTEKATRLIEESNKIISDENKRNSSSFNEDYMGMPGSFRRLNVD